MGNETPIKALVANADAGNPEVRLQTHGKALRIKMWKTVKKISYMGC